jgi:hypothetical protein
MKDQTVKITFKAKESEREELQVLAARARMTQSEFIRTLISDYGETLVRLRRQPSFTPESGLPEKEEYMGLVAPRRYWLTDGEELFDERWMYPGEIKLEQVRAAQLILDRNTKVHWIQSDAEPDIPRVYGFPNHRRFRNSVATESGLPEEDDDHLPYQ